MSTDVGTNLKLLDDLPAVAGEDKFQHQVYADILRDVFHSNVPGICVGLFGKWGQGKSTVVKLLEKNPPANTRIVVFNAWKTRGDALRRQLLLHVLKNIGSERYEDISKFVRPGIPLRLRTAEEQGQYDDKRLWWLLLRNEKVDWWVLGAILVGLGSLCAFVWAIRRLFNAVPAGDVGDLAMWGLTSLAGLGLSCFTAIFRRLQNRKQMLLTSAEPVSDSQRLAYPEQFQKVFEQEVVEFNRTREHLLVVVDDLDRCDPRTVAEALSAIRQFHGQPLFVQTPLECQFLVPCDEEQVILALEADGYCDSRGGRKYHDYWQRELLRKFFDVIIRMDQMLPEDFARYAAELAPRLDLDPKEAMRVVDLVDASDPRQVKKLLNAYRLAKLRLQKSQELGLLPDNSHLPELIPTLILLVALRETRPDVYDRVCAEPHRLTEWIDASANPNDLPDQVIPAAGIFQRSASVSSLTAGYLVLGKVEPELQSLPEGPEFGFAFRKGDTVRVAEILDKASSETTEGLLRFTANKMRQAASPGTLRQHLVVLLEYASGGPKQANAVGPCITAGLKRGLLEQALDEFPHLGKLKSVLHVIEGKERDKILTAAGDNFLRGPEKHDHELNLLVSNLSLVPQKAKRRFTDWVAQETGQSDGGKVNRIMERLLNALPEDRKDCFGSAPDLAVRLCHHRDWRDDQPGDRKDSPEKWPHFQLIPTFVGEDSASAKTCLTVMFQSGGILESARPLGQQTSGTRVAMMTAGRLAEYVSREDAPALFDHLEAWMAVQPDNDSEAWQIVLRTSTPILLKSSDGQMDKAAKHIVRAIQHQADSAQLIECLGKKPANANDASEWESFCEHLFSSLSSYLQGHGALDPAMAEVLQKMHANGWRTFEEADELLASKVNNLASGTQGIEKWVAALQPLLPKQPERTRHAVIQTISHKDQFVRHGLDIGRKTLWKKSIDEGSANAIGNYCHRWPQRIGDIRDHLDQVVPLKGGSRIVEVATVCLSEDPRQLTTMPQLLGWIATEEHRTKHSSRVEFQEKLRSVLVSDKEEEVRVALTALTKCQAILGSTGEEVAKAKERFANTTTKGLAEEILKKPQMETPKDRKTER